MDNMLPESGIPMPPSASEFRDAICNGFSYLTVDNTGVIVDITERCEILFGYESRNYLLGRSIEVLVPLDHREHHPTLRAEYAKNPTLRPMNAGRLVKGLHRSGEEISVLITLRHWYSRNGRGYTTAMIVEVK